MWWSRRGLPVLALALAGCGFAPVYGPGGTGTRLQDRVLVAEPTDQATYLMTRHIEERLGRAVSPEFTLDLALDTRVEGLGIDVAGNTNRFNLIGAADYVLRDAGTGAALTQGRVQSFTGYFASGSTVETLASERDARERLMIILGDLVVARLLATDLPA